MVSREHHHTGGGGPGRAKVRLEVYGGGVAVNGGRRGRPTISDVCPLYESLRGCVVATDRTAFGSDKRGQ